MATLSRDQQNDLLRSLSQMGSAGRAESEDRTRFISTFYPVLEHLKAFDPDVVLIVGPRGAGKSELFKAGIELGLLPAIAKRFHQLRLPPLEKNGTQFLAAYPLEREYPDELGLKKFVLNTTSGSDVFIEYWFAYLVRMFANKLGKMIDGSHLEDLLRPKGGDVSSVLSGFRACGQAPLVALDRLDQELERNGRYLYVGYDELDTLGHGDWRTINALVQGLVSFWSSRSRRWRRIRAKIFLRTDLYERAGASSGADFSKLAANRADITWGDANLYAMLIKRIANSSDDLYGYCRSAKINFEEDTTLLKIPTINRTIEARPLIERMVGQYMGANSRKGLTFKWLLDHIRDGRGQALPRALVRLVESAANGQTKSGNLPSAPKLIEPRAFRRALDEVSTQHVTQSLDEWPWLEGLKDRLRNIKEVPWERRQVEKELHDRWDGSWKSTGDVNPPMDSARDLVDYLIEVGIFRDRSNGRIDVPDLFLAGLGLKRKGGVVQG